MDWLGAARIGLWFNLGAAVYGIPNGETTWVGMAVIPAVCEMTGVAAKLIPSSRTGASARDWHPAGAVKFSGS